MLDYPIEILACPQCGSSLEAGTSLDCAKCRQKFERTESGSLDLRPKLELSREIVHRLPGTQSPIPPLPYFGELRRNEAPEVAFDGVALSIHLTPEMASYIPKAVGPSSWALDLGCGGGEYRSAVEHAGFEWVGCDYQNPRAPILADAHSLPFRDEIFSFAISLAVLEHLHQPSVALRDIRRVLKPGALFLGSVAYLCPFHDSASYFNMTHEGVCRALRDAGFRVRFVAGERKYMGLHAVSYSGLFLDAPRPLAYAIANPILALSRLWWAYRRLRGRWRSSKEMEMAMNTGAFVFLAEKQA